MKLATSTVLFALALAAAAPAGSPARFSIEQDQVLLSYQASLGRKHIAGISRAVAGLAEEVPGVGLRVSARAPVASFESGSAAVDALFRSALQAERFADVEFEGQAPIGKRSGQFTVQLAGTLSLHGFSRPITVPVKVLREGKTLYVHAAFLLDLAGFGLAPPSIDGTALSPRVQIELAALLQPDRPAALAR